MGGLLQSLLASMLDWLGVTWWRPLVAMVMGILAVAALAWLFAWRVRKASRAALGTAWMLGGTILVLLFFGAGLLDLAMAGHPGVPGGGSFVEWKLFGWIPGVELLLPFARVPSAAVVVYQLVLAPFYALLVWLIWWGLVSGSHVSDLDRAQSQAWLHALTGRGPDGRLRPGFVRWFRPLLRALGVVLAVAAIQTLVGAYEPHPAGWVTAWLFVAGASMNLRMSAAPSAPSDTAAEPDAPEEAAEPPPRRAPRAEDVLAALEGSGLAARRAPGGPLPSSRPRRDPDALHEVHRGVREACAALGGHGGPWAFQGELLRRARAGQGTLVVGPRGAGRTAGLQLAALDAALSRWETVLVLVPTQEEARSFASALRGALARGATPELVRVASGLDGLALERDEGHDPVVFVTTPQELRQEVTTRASLVSAFYRGLRTVLVDDLGQMAPEAATALRLALDELQQVIVETSGESAAPPTVIATCSAWGAELEAWASDLVGARLERLEAAGAPRPRCDVLWVDPIESAAAAEGPHRVLEALRGVGYAASAVDELHSLAGGRGSWAPLPCWELPAPSPSTSGAEATPSPRATVVLARRCDASLAAARHRPVGDTAGGPAVLVVYVADADRVPVAVVRAAEAAERDLSGEREAPLRLQPRGHRVARMTRRHLVECLSRPRRLAWLRQVFDAADLGELLALARQQGAVDERDRVALSGEPPGLITEQTVVLKRPPDLSGAPRWHAGAPVHVVSSVDGEVLVALEGAIADSLAFPGSACVVDGRRWELAGDAEGAVRRADPRRSSHVVRRRAMVGVKAVDPIGNEVNVAFGDAHAALAVGAWRVRLSETVSGRERRAPSGRLEDRQAFTVPRVASYETAAVGVGLPAGLPEEPPARLALETAARVALSALAALPEEAFEVALSAGSDGSGTRLWIIERADEGGSLVPWLRDRVVGRRWFWEVLLEVLRSGARPGWWALRTDDSEEEPDAATAWAWLSGATGLEGVDEGEPGLEPVTATARGDAAPEVPTGPCVACGEPITDSRWYTWRADAKDPEARSLCVRCHDVAERCDACGVPTERDLHRWPDGRVSCPSCVSTAVATEEQAKGVVEEGLRGVGRVLDVPVESTWRVEVGDAHALAAAGGRAFAPTRESDSRAVGLCVGRPGDFTLYLEQGLPRVMALETFMHEYAHAWQVERNPALRDEELSEGFATWVSYRGLIALGHRRDAERLLGRGGVYGSGLRRLLRKERNEGPHAVLQEVLSTGSARDAA